MSVGSIGKSSSLDWRPGATSSGEVRCRSRLLWQSGGRLASENPHLSRQHLVALLYRLSSPCKSLNGGYYDSSAMSLHCDRALAFFKVSNACRSAKAVSI